MPKGAFKFREFREDFGIDALLAVCILHSSNLLYVILHDFIVSRVQHGSAHAI